MDDEFLLKWHDHHQSFFLLVEELVMREQLTDVTLACGGGEDQQLLSAHSLMLSVCSPYFRSLLSENRHKEKHHIIHLHGVSARHMQQLLLYMYRGEISISQEDLGPLIETAKCLQIKGLAMAQPNVNIVSPVSSKKRTFSQMSPSGENSPQSSSIQPSNKSKKSKTKHRPPSPSLEEPVNSSQEYSEPIKGDIAVEKREEEKEVKDFPPDCQETYNSNFNNKAPPGSQLSPMGVSLPLLPKPLSILKTAETRTYLSKLIWLGNGGRRPQYGNPETKPHWWPQHILPWEEMKKMGGRKSVELSHINYTEILKQCLAAGYEYFGYDPATYYSNDQQECSYVIEDGHNPGVEEDAGSSGGDRQDQPVLEIDLDQVTEQKQNVRRNDPKQILCK